MSILVVILTLLSSFLITFLLMPSLIRYFPGQKRRTADSGGRSDLAC